MKWVYLGAGVALVGGAVWQFLREAAKVKAASQRERQPWETV